MKQLLLFAIVGAGIIGATTAFASSNIININVQSLGASPDAPIPTDMSAAAVNFNICQNYGTGTVPANPNPTPCPLGTPVTTVLGIQSCQITDTIDTTINTNDLLICKLTGPVTTEAGTVDGVVDEGAATAGSICTQGVEPTTTPCVAGANGDFTCTVASPCNFDILMNDATTGGHDVQSVEDVKIIDKGQTVSPPSPLPGTIT